MVYKKVYLIGSSTIVGLFAILLALGFQISSPTGDFACSGDYRTQTECSSLNLSFGKDCGPCMSKITITNPTPNGIYVYNTNQFNISFSPNIEDYAFYVKNTKCTGKLTGNSCSCYLSDGTEYAIKGYSCVDFTNRTKPSKTSSYVYSWAPYSVKEHLLIGFKKSPQDTIKWTINTSKDTLDPKWEGMPIDEFYLFSDCINKTYITEEIISPGNVIIHTNTLCKKEGIIYYNGTIFDEDRDFYCSINQTNRIIECDSNLDGNGNGFCNREGGETCKVYKLTNKNEMFVRYSNSDKYKIPTKNETTKSYDKQKKPKKEKIEVMNEI